MFYAGDHPGVRCTTRLSKMTLKKTIEGVAYLRGLHAPLLYEGLGSVGDHVGQQGALVVLLGGAQQLQPWL